MTGDDLIFDATSAGEEQDADASGSPIYWPTLTAEEVELEWPALRAWVEHLLVRFPNCPRVPACWWRHNDLVELFSALRDHERASFASSALATAAMDWHRAFRDVELRAETWIRRFTCMVPGRGHSASSGSEDWEVFVADDVRARRIRFDRRLPV